MGSRKRTGDGGKRGEGDDVAKKRFELHVLQLQVLMISLHSERQHWQCYEIRLVYRLQNSSEVRQTQNKKRKRVLKRRAWGKKRAGRGTWLRRVRSRQRRGEAEDMRWDRTDSACDCIKCDIMEDERCVKRRAAGDEWRQNAELNRPSGTAARRLLQAREQVQRRQTGVTMARAFRSRGRRRSQKRSRRRRP
jgi:hypothetical protein